MTYASCPTVVVHAPIDIVWKLLTQPARWGDFFDLRITGVEPAGPVVIGQRFCGESGPRFLHFGLQFEFTEVNAAEHKLGLNVRFPFGITVREDLSCTSVSSAECRVSYHCSFAFPKGWRGAVARVVLHREAEAGPADSLARLKHAAEERYTAIPP
jgi:hypothetical protein